MKYKLYLILSLILSTTLEAQKDSSFHSSPSIKLVGFLDVFYGYDFNQPEAGQRQDFFFNHNRHNEFNLNLGLLQIQVDQEKYRAKLGLQSGTYAAEEDVFQNIYQANIGVALDKKNRWWLDAGIFESNLGFESALSIENWNLSRALSSESSPYYLAGAKINFQADEHWSITALVSNGWQRIKRVEGNSLLSFGSQVEYQEKNRFKLNWSTFVGTDEPDENRKMRYFNNFYASMHPTAKFNLLLGLDVGFQEREKNSNNFDNWMVFSFLTQYEWSESWKTSFRLEYMEDKDEVIVNSIHASTFQTTSLSLNLDYLPNKQTAVRMEGRWLTAANNAFDENGSPTGDNFFFLTSIAIKFDSQLK